MRQLLGSTPGARPASRPRLAGRQRHFRKHERCFTGTEACAWLVKQGMAQHTADAEALGVQLMRLGLLHHVEYKHGFRNKDHLYR